MINKKYLDILYELRADKQSLLKAETEIEDFKEGDCSIALHNASVIHLQNSINDIDYLITAYLKTEVR